MLSSLDTITFYLGQPNNSSPTFQSYSFAIHSPYSSRGTLQNKHASDPILACVKTLQYFPSAISTKSKSLIVMCLSPDYFHDFLYTALRLVTLRQPRQLAWVRSCLRVIALAFPGPEYPSAASHVFTPNPSSVLRLPDLGQHLLQCKRSGAID